MRMGSGDFGKSKSKDNNLRFSISLPFLGNLATSLEMTKVVGNEVKLRDQDSTNK